MLFSSFCTQCPPTCRAVFTLLHQFVANCVIFYNVHAMSEVLHQLQQQGHAVDEEVLSALGPSIRQHIDCVGRYQLNLNQCPSALDYDRFTPSPISDAATASILIQQQFWSSWVRVVAITSSITRVAHFSL